LQADPTGVPNLDMVLGGGLPRGALVIIVGPPGSGKTTLANQMAFAAARAGRRAMVLAALSEPTSKLIAHLRSFTFFDDELTGDTIQFLSLQQFLSGGLESTANEMVAAARRAHASFVVLDGFRGVRGVDLDPQAARKFLYDVGTTLSVLGATTIITSEADPRDPAFFPEATTADIIIGLHFDLLGIRQRRRLEVIKMRGAAPLPGLHGLALGLDGVVIYPRLETRITLTSQAPQPETVNYEDVNKVIEDEIASPANRVPFDLPELDGLLSGGLTRHTNTLVLGSIATGKTLLGVHFALAGVRRGEPTIFLGFRENYRQLLLKTSPFTLGRELREALAPGGGLTLLRFAPVELNADILATELLAALDRTGAKRLVVDSITELERAAIESGDSRRVENYMAALVEALHRRGVTALFIREVSREIGWPPDLSMEPTSILAENMLLLRQVEQQGVLHRVVSVQKMRFSAHDSTKLREFKIEVPVCIRVLETDGGTAHVGSGSEQSQRSTRALGLKTNLPQSGRVRRSQPRKHDTGPGKGGPNDSPEA
jgi:circadian clock protein KaiC